MVIFSNLEISEIFASTGNIADMDAIDVLDPTHPPTHLHSTLRFLRVDRRDISFLRFVLEAYEGVAVLTTLDAAKGVVSISVAPGSEPMVEEILKNLNSSGEIMAERLPDRSTALKVINEH